MKKATKDILFMVVITSIALLMLAYITIGNNATRKRLEGGSNKRIEGSSKRQVWEEPSADAINKVAEKYIELFSQTNSSYAAEKAI